MLDNLEPDSALQSLFGNKITDFPHMNLSEYIVGKEYDIDGYVDSEGNIEFMSASVYATA